MHWPNGTFELISAKNFILSRPFLLLANIVKLGKSNPKYPYFIKIYSIINLCEIVAKFCQYCFDCNKFEVLVGIVG